jgi:hypothetical protein
MQDDSSQEVQPKRINLLGPFSLSWRDKSKVTYSDQCTKI